MTVNGPATASAWGQISRLALLASIVESVDDAIISETLDGVVTSWNPAAERIYGYASDEVIGQPMSMLMPAGRAEEMIGVLERVSNGVPVERYNTVRLRKDGAQIPVSRIVSPVRDDDGTVIGASAIERDITERVEVEERLRAASQYARSLIEASLDPLVTISPEGNITDVNEATAKVTGLPRESLIGTAFSDYFTEPDKAREAYRRVFAEGSVTDCSLTLHHRNGELREVLYNASLFKGPDGEVLGVVAAARDITVIMRARREVAEQRASELSRIAELERFQQLVVGRELRMIELKEEITELNERVRVAARAS